MGLQGGVRLGATGLGHPVPVCGHPGSRLGGPGRGTVRIDGTGWQSYIATPPFAEHVSGHSTFSAAAAEILRRFTGSDAFGGSATVAAGAVGIEAGVVPATPVLLTWPTFTSAAGQAGYSRRLGGIHFELGDLAGRRLGRLIAAQVWEHALAYFAGRHPSRTPSTTGPGQLANDRELMTRRHIAKFSGVGDAPLRRSPPAQPSRRWLRQGDMDNDTQFLAAHRDLGPAGWIHRIL